MALSLNDAFLTGVRATLLDPTGVYWSESELVGYYNLFVVIAIGENPTALTKSVPFSLAAGVDQVLPSDAVQFLRSPSNVNGPGISQVTGDAMQDADPYWYQQPPTSLVKHVVPDERDPLRFRVWPPNSGTGAIFVSYAYAPNDAVDGTSDFTLTEAYRAPARDAVLGMAYAKNTDRGDLQKSAFHFSRLDQGIASQLQATARTMARIATPNTSE